jgi:hypothetical protein
VSPTPCVPVVNLIIPHDQVSLSGTINGTSRSELLYAYTQNQAIKPKSTGIDALTFKALLSFTATSYSMTLVNSDYHVTDPVIPKEELEKFRYMYKISLSDSTNPRYYLTGIDECHLQVDFKGKLKVTGVEVYVY